MKNESTFYNKKNIDRIHANIENSEWAQSVRNEIVGQVSYWAGLSDEELWGMMFGNTIMRSWMVLSDGNCPSCKKSAVMYSWIADPVNQPWKMKCPNCGELFPKNDFDKYYKTGLDERGIFNIELADKSLLYNEEHPDKGDPLYKFGVDDSNGYTEGNNTWRFIGAYLIYGHWKRLILEGLNRLSAAYVVTGDMMYAHKAGIILDRIADLYPTFDFAKDGILYDGRNICPGYVSYSVDACVESKGLFIAYDRVFDGMKQDESLVKFLMDKACTYKGIAAKSTFEDIQKNIEINILKHVVDNPAKTNCNYPNTDAAYTIARMVWGRKENEKEIMKLIRNMVKRTTAVDGVTGEKGLASYSAWTIRVFAEFLGLCSLADDDFLKDLFVEFPQIHKTYRFHIDTWCLSKYYPLVGDTGSFAKPFDNYLGVTLDKNSGINASMFTFLWKLYELTGDSDFVKLMYKHNGNSVVNLPYDITVENPALIQKTVQDIVDREGRDLVQKSVNKTEWGLAILASGKGTDSRALWMHYDTERDHSHLDAMNIGLYGKGLDLMPDFGYPPVQYGGWFTPQVYWYSGTASHNTVMVGRDNQRNIKNYSPKANLWSIGEYFKAIRVSEPRFIAGRQYERTLMLIDISEQDSYVVDIFRVAGGREHVKFMHSSLSSMTAEGMQPGRCAGFNSYGLMANFRTDENASQGWAVDWKLEPGNLVPDYEGAVHLKYSDATKNAQAYTADGWVATDSFDSKGEAWIPRLLQINRIEGSDEELLQTAFAGVIEPYSDCSNLAEVKRLDLQYTSGITASEADIAIQIEHKDGTHDLIISRDVEDPKGYRKGESKPDLKQPEWNVYTDCEVLMVRKSNDNKLDRLVMCKGSFVYIDGVSMYKGEPVDFKEILK